MEPNKNKTNRVLILSGHQGETTALSDIIKEGPYEVRSFRTLEMLEQELQLRHSVAVILDIDSVPLDNRTIRRMTMHFPATSFFCTSLKRFHPKLKEAICYHIFACIKKPVDPDELHYFLRCVRENETESRGPPLP